MVVFKFRCICYVSDKMYLLCCRLEGNKDKSGVSLQTLFFLVNVCIVAEGIHIK